MKEIATYFNLLFVLASFMLSMAYALPNPLQDLRVQNVYEEFKEELLWIHGGNWTPCAQTLFRTLLHVEEDGLWQEDYNVLIHAAQKADLNSIEGQKKADALLTLAALNYISDMKGERVNPRAAVKEIHVEPIRIEEALFLKQYLSQSNQCGWIQELAPAFPEYKRLKKLLAFYRQKKAQGGWPQLPKGTKLQRGDKGFLVQILRTQLLAQDAFPLAEERNDYFDENLEQAVKVYQSLHGLEPDGKIGPGTLAVLNTSVEDRIRSLIVSLERLRWFPNPLPQRYIQVNIPGFYLKAVAEGGSVLFMSTITGQEYRKTPVFNAMLTEIIFNPAWHVPLSIAVKDKLPKLQKNPNAFEGMGYHIYDSSGQEVSPSSVDWSAYSQNFFPFRIHQSPGDANALGKIRFTIESPFSIYLHGTPDEKLFQKAKRTLSSGCIRVQDPYKLAEFVFDNPQKWTLSRIIDEASGTVTKKVKLGKTIPVFITYITVFEDQEGQIHFAEDVYGQDKKVWLALERVRRSSIKPSTKILTDSDSLTNLIF